MAGKTMRVMLIDDHPVVRTGIRRIIELEDDMEVICEAGDVNEAIRLMGDGNPDVAVIDISISGESDGIDLVKAIKSRYDNVRSVMLSMHDENLYAERAIRAGASGYVTKKEAPEKIVDAIRSVMGGELYLSSDVSKKIIEKLLHGSVDTQASPVDTLTDREFEVFQFIGRGFGAGEIARKLNLSASTVDSHKANIKSKLGLETGSELTKTAIQWVLNQK